MANYTKIQLCSCGNPQSYPLPHEHDRTEREKQIVLYYEGITKALYEALKEVWAFLAPKCHEPRVKMICDNIGQALAQAEREEG